MFSFFDFLFREERAKNSLGRDFGMTESTSLQLDVKDSENENDRKGIYTYESEEVNSAIVHTRQDVVMVIAILQRTNILLRWIRFLLVCLFVLFLLN